MNYLAHWQSKTPPPTIEQYMPIKTENETNSVVNRAREAYLKIAEEYYLKTKQNG